MRSSIWNGSQHVTYISSSYGLYCPGSALHNLSLTHTVPLGVENVASTV